MRVLSLTSGRPDVSRHKRGAMVVNHTAGKTIKNTKLKSAGVSVYKCVVFIISTFIISTHMHAQTCICVCVGHNVPTAQ